MTERIEGVYSCTPMVNCATKKISLRAVNKVLILALFTCGIYYITTINDLVVKGFVLQGLEVKAQVLGADNKSMNDHAVALKSCDDLSSRIQALGMVSTDKIDYIKVGKGALASR